MSHLSLRRLVVLLAATGALGATGCATIVKGGGGWGQVQLRDVPKMEGDDALAVWVDGQPAKWSYQFSGFEGADQVKSEPTLDLATSSDHRVRVQVGGCAADFLVSSSVSGMWVVLDIFVGLGIGVIVDWATGAWREFDDATILWTPTLMAQAGKPVGAAPPKIPCGNNPARVTRGSQSIRVGGRPDRAWALAAEEARTARGALNVTVPSTPVR